MMKKLNSGLVGRVEIEEGIYDIQTRKPVMKSIFEYNDEILTKNLFMIGDSDINNSKVYVISEFKITTKDISTLTVGQISKKLKKRLSDSLKENIKKELGCYKFPKITGVRRINKFT